LTPVEWFSALFALQDYRQPPRSLHQNLLDVGRAAESAMGEVLAQSE
jgi:hypothetical protein